MKRILCMIFALALAVSAGACSAGSNEPPKDTAALTTQAATQAASDSAEPVDVSYDECDIDLTAMNSTMTTLATSPGWNENEPMESQMRLP